MNNPSQQPEEPKFDLFATDVEDNLKDELAKGAFQWTDKYTKRLSLLLTATVLVSGGIWYGHYYTNNQITSSVAGAASSLRSAFAGGGFSGGGAASGASAAGGAGAAAAGAGAGFGGFGGARITGTITKVSGSDVTITLSDPTQASTLKTGDAARVTDTAAAAAAGGAGAAPGAGGFAGGAASGAGAGAGTGAASGAGGTTTRGSGKASGKAGATSGTTSGKAAAGGTSAAGGAGAGAAAGGRPAGGFGGGAGAGGGFAAKFSDPQVVACFKQNGVTITAGSPPNFQDPNFRSALTACASVLGITPGAGGAGGGFGGGAAAGGTGTGGFGGGRTRGATPSPTATP